MKNIIIITLCVVTSSCSTFFIKANKSNSYQENYEYVWQDFKNHYGIFRAKNLDWDSVKTKYDLLIKSVKNDEDLYNFYKGFFEELNDAHVSFQPLDDAFPIYRTAKYGQLFRDGYRNFSPNLIKEKYLTNVSGNEYDVKFGDIGEDIGYLQLQIFSDDLKLMEERLKEINERFSSKTKIIIDIRNNYGGEDELGRMIASYFANSNYTYMTSAFKSGPGTNDFDAQRKWRVSPNEKSKISGKKLYVLTNNLSISAAETFVLAIRETPNCIVLGDKTAGAFSDVISREMPNGWTYRLPIGEYLDKNGKSWEGIGLNPDVFIDMTKEDISNKNDKLIEFVIKKE